MFHQNPNLDGDRQGVTYERTFDYNRLNKQQKDVYNIMKDGHWHPLHELARDTMHPEASVSARIRDLRKSQFGGFDIERVRNKNSGLFYYRMKLPTQGQLL
jgi:biotin operon repressor